MSGFRSSSFAACRERDSFPVRIYESPDVWISVLAPQADGCVEQLFPTAGIRTPDRWAIRYRVTDREILGFLSKADFDSCLARHEGLGSIESRWDVQQAESRMEAKAVCASCIARHPDSYDCTSQLYGRTETVHALALLGQVAGPLDQEATTPIRTLLDTMEVQQGFSKYLAKRESPVVESIQELIQRFDLLNAETVKRGEQYANSELREWVGQFQTEGPGTIIPIEWALGFAAALIYGEREFDRADLEFLLPRLNWLSDGCMNAVKRFGGPSVEVLVPAIECLTIYRHHVDLALRFQLRVRTVA